LQKFAKHIVAANYVGEMHRLHYSNVPLAVALWLDSWRHYYVIAVTRLA